MLMNAEMLYMFLYILCVNHMVVLLDVIHEYTKRNLRLYSSYKYVVFNIRL